MAGVRSTISAQCCTSVTEMRSSRVSDIRSGMKKAAGVSSCPPLGHRFQWSSRIASAGDNGASAAASAPKGSDSACPVLRSLQLPPVEEPPFWPPLRSLTNPPAFAAEVMKGRNAVRAKFLGLEFSWFAGTDALKAAWGAESQGAVVQKMPPDNLKLWGEESLFVTNGPKHMRLRRLLNPAFSPEQSLRAAPQIADICRRYLTRWAREGEVNAGPELKLLTFEVIANVVLGFGFTGEELEANEKRFEAYVGGLTGLPIPEWVPNSPRSLALRARAELAAVIEDSLDKMKRAVESGAGVGGREGSVLHTLVLGTEDGEKLSTQQVVDNMLLLMFAGHDTSANALTNLLYQLSRADPSIVAALREEQAAVVAAHGDDYSPDALKQMPYLETVLQENLRVLPLVPFSNRVAEADLELSGYSVPAGTRVLFPLPYMIANDPRWDESDPSLPPEFHPSRFNPSRWSSPFAKQTGSTYFPFGGGPHSCLGATLANAEMRVFVAELVRGYEFSADTGVEFEYMPLTRPKGGRLITRVAALPAAVPAAASNTHAPASAAA